MAERRRIRRKRTRQAPAVRRPAGAAREGGAETGEAPLMIGGAKDAAEGRADRLATRALSGLAGHGGGAPGGSGGTGGAGAGTVRRMCAECAAEEKTRRAPGPAPSVAPGARAAPASPGAAKAITSLGSGRALSAPARAFFEPRLGADLSGVRIHTGPAADRAARAIDARAFTRGRDVALAQGAETPGILAHELAHVATEPAGPARRMVRRACETCRSPVNPTVDVDITPTVKDVATNSDFGECLWASSAAVTRVDLLQTRKETCDKCKDGDGNDTPRYEFCPTKITARATVDVHVNEDLINDTQPGDKKAYRDCAGAGRPNIFTTDADATANGYKRKTVAGVTEHELYHMRVGIRLWKDELKARNDIGSACPYTIADHVAWLDALEAQIKSDSETFLKGNPNEPNEEQNARAHECSLY